MDRENAKKFVQEVRLEPVLLYSSLTTDCTEKVAFTTENREGIITSGLTEKIAVFSFSFFVIVLILFSLNLMLNFC